MELKSKYKENDLRLCAIIEGLLPEGAEMTDEIRAEAAIRLDFAGIKGVRKNAD